jgi:hypothetical protein
MPFGTIKLKPGIDTTSTPTLSEAAYSASQLIRFLPDRNGLGLAQKMGGWINYFNSSIGSAIRALKGWADLNAVNHLGIGAESSLNVLTESNLINITPQNTITNTAPVFATTAGSTTVTITDSNITASVLDYVDYVTPVAVGGVVLTGPYQLLTAAGTTYSITAPSAALSTANTSTNTVGGSFVVGKTYKIVSVGSTNFTLIGAASNTVGVIFNATGVGSGSGTAKLVGVYAFQTTNGLSTVTCYFDNHGYSVGESFYIGVSTTVGGITLSGLYTVLTVPSANSFTFAAANTATSSAGPTAINSGNVNSNFYIAIGPQPTSTGFGVGGYGAGGFGVGTTQTSVPGTPITASDWTLDNFGSYLVGCPAGGAIYYYDPDGQLQNAQIVGGTSPLVNSGIFVAMPQRQIVAYGSSFTLQSDPMLIRWCDVGNFGNWIASSTNQAGSYRIPTGSKIVCGIQGPQQGLIWTDTDLWAMQYVGTPFIYSFNKIGSNCGGVSRHCVGQLNGNVFWMSQRQFFMSTGNGVQVLQCPIWDIVFQQLSTSQFPKVVCGVNSQFNEIIWFFPTGNSTENTTYVKYNHSLGQWDYGTLGRSAWIDQSVLDQPIAAGTDYWLYQHEKGSNAVYNGVTTGMQSSFSTGYFQLNEAESMVFVDQIWPDMKWGYADSSQNATVYLTINYTNYATVAASSPTTSYYSAYPTGTVSSVTIPITQSTEYVSCRIRARYMSFSLSSNDFDTFWRLGAIKYRYQPDGKF